MATIPFTDDFADGSIAADWTTSLATETGGRLRMTANTSYSGFAELKPFAAVRDTSWSAAVYPPVGTTVFQWFEIFIDENNGLRFPLDQEGGTPGVLRFIERVGGSDNETTLAYNSTTHRWRKFLVEGTAVKWQTSEDGSSWTTRREKTTTLNVDGSWGFATGSGYWGSAPSPTYLEIDNFAAVSTVVAAKPKRLTLLGVG